MNNTNPAARPTAARSAKRPPTAPPADAPRPAGGLTAAEIRRIILDILG